MKVKRSRSRSVKIHRLFSGAQAMRDIADENIDYSS